MTIGDLIAKIKAAFPDDPWPDGNRACPHRCWECDEMSAQVSGRRWTDLTERDFCSLYDGTSLFSEEAFAYFLPAFMTIALTDETYPHVAYLAHCYLPNLSSDKLQRTTNLLSAKQAEALFDWLDWYIVDRIEGGIKQTRSVKANNENHERLLERHISEEEDRLQRYEAVVARLRIERDLSE